MFCVTVVKNHWNGKPREAYRYDADYKSESQRVGENLGLPFGFSRRPVAMRVGQAQSSGQNKY